MDAPSGLRLKIKVSALLPALSNAQVRFRLQDNPVQVEVTDAELLDEKFKRAVVTLPWREWERMRQASENYIVLLTKQGVERGAWSEPIAIEEVASSVNANLLKGALLMKVPCPKCATKTQRDAA